MFKSIIPHPQDAEHLAMFLGAWAVACAGIYLWYRLCAWAIEALHRRIHSQPSPIVPQPAQRRGHSAPPTFKTRAAKGLSLETRERARLDGLMRCGAISGYVLPSAPWGIDGRMR